MKLKLKRKSEQQNHNKQSSFEKNSYLGKYLFKSNAVCVLTNTNIEDISKIMYGNAGKEVNAAFPNLAKDISYVIRHFSNDPHILKNVAPLHSMTSSYINPQKDWTKIMNFPIVGWPSDNRCTKRKLNVIKEYRDLYKPEDMIQPEHMVPDLDIIAHSIFVLQILIQALKWSRIIIPKIPFVEDSDIQEICSYYNVKGVIEFVKD